MSRARGRRAVPALLLGVLSGVFLCSAAGARPLEGRFALEMEYLGQNYYNEAVIDFLAADDVTERVVETTRFSLGTWLPGQRLDLRFRPSTSANGFDIRSTTGWNAQRFFQEFDGRYDWRGAGGRLWSFRALGQVREEEQSLVGHGDWHAGAEVRHARPLGAGLLGRVEARMRHSRTRGDTTSFVYDYDRVDLRAAVTGGGRYGTRWEGYGRGVRKTVPAALGGAYAEVALGGAYRSDGRGRTDLTLELSRRDYSLDETVGRDVLETEMRLRTDVWHGGLSALRVDLDLRAADYRGADALYYDFAQATLHTPLETSASAWTLNAGPRFRWLRDLARGGRDYSQWGLRTGAGRSLGGLGFFQADLDAGYRDYQARLPETVEIATLSTTLLRSDYWLMDFMLLADIPLMAGFSLDVLANTAFEWHVGEEERVNVTFATVSIARGF